MTISVRSDFQNTLTSAITNLHSQGGMLPLLSPPTTLPAQNPFYTAPSDWLPLIGRELSIMPTVTLADPTTDPIALASQTSGGPYQLVALASGAGAPAAAAWYALAWIGGVLTEIPLASAQFIPLAPLLAKAGFYPASLLPKPAGTSDVSWAKLTNITGLVPGVTTLQSELLLLYCANEIGGSALASYLQYVWNGTTFS